MWMLLIGCISLHVDAFTLNDQGRAIKAGLELTVPDLEPQNTVKEPIREVSVDMPTLSYKTLKGWGADTLLLSQGDYTQLAFGFERTWTKNVQPYGAQKIWRTTAVGAQALSFQFESGDTRLNMLQPYGSLGLMYVFKPEQAIEIGLFRQAGRGILVASDSPQSGFFISYRVGFQPYFIPSNPVSL